MGTILLAMISRPLRRLALSLALMFSSFPGDAAEPVDIELVLAIDSSSSVDAEEFAFQMDGLSAAFLHPSILAAIESGTHQAIAVTVVEWADARRQTINLPWRRVGDAGTLGELARDLENAPRMIYGGGTSISGAIAFGMQQFGKAFAAERRVIDVSGDGRNNLGLPPESARDAAVEAGIVVNGLAITNEDASLDTYYREHVIGGPGAFALKATDYQDFARAILEKLLREIGAVPIVALPGSPRLAAR